MRPMALGMLALLFLVGCVPPALPFNPSFQVRGTEVEWDHGVAWARQSDGGLIAKAAFIEAGPGTMLFDVVLENRSELAVLVSPERVDCELRLSGDDPLPLNTLRAVDPETQMELLARDAYAIRRRREVEQATHGVVAMAGLAVAAVDTVDRATTQDPQRRRDASTTHAGLDLAATALNADVASSMRAKVEASKKADGRDLWEMECLRRTTIHPGARYRGKLVFHGDASAASTLRLRIPVGERVFVFTFQPRMVLRPSVPSTNG